MASFINTASKKVTDVREFLREASNSNSIKYAPTKGEKDILYIPYVTAEIANGDETVTVKQTVAISGNLHEWHGADGKYKATICIKGVVREDENSKVMLNDGSCPFCDRVADAWEIYNYRKNQEDAICKLTGEERKKHLESANRDFADERKAKDARAYVYMLIVKFKTKSGQLIINSDTKLPEYDLKVMKMSASRVEKLQQQIANSGSELAGSELLIDYPNVDDRRLVVSQSTTSLVFPDNMATRKYPALLDKITADVSKFDWEGVEKSFPEWEGMTTSEANRITKELFEKWDEYKAEARVNPTAKYLEYVSNVQISQPEIGIAAPSISVPNGNAPLNVDINSVLGQQPNIGATNGSQPPIIQI